MKAMPIVKVLTILVFVFLMGSFVAFRSGLLPNPFIGNNSVQTISGEGANTLVVSNKTGVRDTPPPNETIMPSSKLSPVFSTGDIKATSIFKWDTGHKVFYKADSISKFILDTSIINWHLMGSSKSLQMFDNNDLEAPADTPPKKAPEMMRGSKSAPVFVPNQSNQSANPK